MSKEKYGSLIGTLAEDKTVLLHGTSIEATIHFLETGVFDYRIQNSENYQYQDYLFFSPNGRYFQENNLELDIDECTWKKSLYWAESYAKGLSDNHYIQTIVGFKPKYIGEVCGEWWAAEKYLLPEFKQHGFNKEYLKKLFREMEKRKGVILGFNEKIFEKNIEKGKDTPEMEVCIHLPKGLTIDYISGIQPLGPVEEKILREYKNK